MESGRGARDVAVEKKQVYPATFRAFGGGSVFCPRRHFAQVEIISFVAAVVIAFDLVPPQARDISSLICPRTRSGFKSGKCEVGVWA